MGSIARRRLYAAAVVISAGTSGCTTSGSCILVMTPAVVASVVDGETGASVVAGASGTIRTPSFYRTMDRTGHDGTGGPPMLFMVFAPADRYTVSIRHPDYRAWDSTVNVREQPGCNNTITVNLAVRLTR